MSLIVCQVIADRPGQLTFTWSDGINPFEPYTLDRLPLDAFRKAVRDARERLAEFVHLHLADPQPAALRQASHDLAVAGRALYVALFAPDAGQLPKAAAVRSWLDALNAHPVDAEPNTMEVVAETEDYVPWNLVYDARPPAPATFPPPDDPSPALPAKAAPWAPFWGVRYNLACGRRVNPLRRLPLWEQPDVVLVIDPEIRASLPDDQLQRLDVFAARGRAVVTSRAEFAAALTGTRPYVVYWLGHATPDALTLGGDEIRPADLMTLLRGDPLSAAPTRRGLLFLNACQTGQGGRAGSFLDAVFAAGLSGLIATEEFTINTFASTFGLDFLAALLDSGQPLGRILHRLRRAGLPLGLLYTAYCPPDIQILAAPKDTDAQPDTKSQPASTSGPGSSIIRCRQRPLPDNPYRGLAPYRREHRALFAGRDDDVQRFAELVNEPGSRLLVLHGEMGVGKSSFLQAGLLPYLEEDCVGYRALRNQAGAGPAGDDAPALFIRANRDLVGQTAKALCDFASRPYRYRTPKTADAPEGREIQVPLADILGRLTGGAGGPPDAAGLRAAMVADPSLPARFLAALGQVMPFGLVLVIDQVEEIFTLDREETEANRRAGLEMLRWAVRTPGDFKFILAVRTDYHGRLTSALRHGLPDLRGLRDYLLTDLGEAELIEAVIRPTADVPLPYSSERPRTRYRFTYAPGVAESIVAQAQAAARAGHDSALLLTQVVGSRLYEAVVGRPDRTITSADLEQVGGVAGALQAHAEALLDRLVKQAPPGPAANPEGRTLLSRLFTSLAPETSERAALKRLFRRLYVRQSDGHCAAALVSAADLEARWRGRAAFADVVQAASGEDFRLLRETSLLSGDREELYLGLGHDALAPVAAAWDEEVQSGARVRQAVKLGFLSALVAVALIALAYGVLLGVAELVARGTLVENSRQSSALAAKFAADKVPWTVRRYWRYLKEAADDGKLRGWLGDPGGAGPRAEMLEWTRAKCEAHAEGERAIPGQVAWVLLDRDGTLVANSFDERLVGDDFSFRDYFHGKGHMERDRAGRERPRPITREHLSPLFRSKSKSDPTPRVACSVPVLAAPAGGQVVGVLVVTLAPSGFLQLPEKELEGRSRVALFLDRKGLVGSRWGCPDAGSPISPDTEDAGGSISPDTLAALDARPDAAVRGLCGKPDDGPWIAAKRDVQFKEGEAEAGWSIVVAELESEVRKPLSDLWFWATILGVGKLLLVLVAGVVLIPVLAKWLRPEGTLVPGRPAARPPKGVKS